MKLYIIALALANTLFPVAAIVLNHWDESYAIAGALLCGWWEFLRRTVPQVSMNWTGVISGLLTVGLLIVLLDRFARSCCRAVSAKSGKAPRGWRFRWTLSMVATFLVMFAVGYSTIALARHVGWVLSSDEPMFERKEAFHLKTESL